jgi:hypothetical protein
MNSPENKNRNLVIGNLFLLGIFLILPAYAHAQVFGSGFFISDDGYFVTNQHVIAGASKIELRMTNGITYPVNLIRSDEISDLAILKASGKFKPLFVDTSIKLKLGDKVFTLGFPNADIQGLAPKYTEGVISSLTGIRDAQNNYQISVAVQPGNSGGPLSDMRGRVVGVVTAKLSANAMIKSGRSIPENVNYAVKSIYLKNLIDQSPKLEINLLALNSKLSQGKDAVSSTEESIAMVLVTVKERKEVSRGAVNNGIDNFSLTCSGVVNTTSNLGASNHYENSSYTFTNGKLFGKYDASFSDSSILVQIAGADALALSSPVTRLQSRTIIFDRLTASVTDTMYSINNRFPVRSDVGINVIYTFTGRCEKAEVKF